jgi:predicted transcriptional regulator
MADNTDNSAELSSALLRIVSAIVSGYVRHNQLPISGLPAIITSVHGTLDSLIRVTRFDRTGAETAMVSIKKSITPDYIVCLEDGKKLKMLKRYLRSRYNLTPDQYRTRWGLPANYPMVAPNYAATRSALAKKTGLGRKVNTPKRRKRA